MPRRNGGRRKTEPREPSVARPNEVAEPAGDRSDTGAQDPGPSRGYERAGFPIVGLGASAGGLEAFEAFFDAMPADSGTAFVLVAHLDPSHVSLLPELIQKHTSMPVRQARHGIEVEANSVYVIPANKELRIVNRVLRLTQLSRPRGANLPIDVFLRSLAQDQAANAVCIILSGTGTDGTLGLKAVKGEGGMVMVQEEGSARYDGMPRSAIATGLADYVLPPERMPEQLIRYTRHAALTSSPSIKADKGPIPDALASVFTILRSRSGHDFSLYKKNTICRRIERRMSVHQIDEISDYVRYLERSEREAEILFKELLIGVTSFFRDPDAFEALREKALLELLRSKPHERTVRVWVPGCASGEEAYSIGILLRECTDELERNLDVQIFATDIDENAITAARAGVYPPSIVADVSPERLERYFDREDDGQYRIAKGIREMVVFAPQNIIKDPPFTKLDLLSCRNLLIYLGPELQRKLLPVLHYSLAADGILFLGSSETIGQATDLFATADKRWKIFRRKPSSSAAHVVLEFPAAARIPDEPRPQLPTAGAEVDEIRSLQLVETILQQSTTPPCAIIDRTYNVVYTHGRLGKFLEPAEGRASLNIVEMARPGLKGELATALHKVTRDQCPLVRRGVEVDENGITVVADVTVKPILDPRSLSGLLMVTFEQTEAGADQSPDVGVAANEISGANVAPATAEEFQNELQSTRESLYSAIEELQSANEELQSANEELQSANEELQSTNEELETSKEELQSLNEESVTVNAELQSRIEELSKANDDIKNLLDSTDLATVFLDTELRIRRFTPKVTEIIPLAGTDVGRPLAHFASNLVETDLARHAEQVLNELVRKELSVRDKRGRRLEVRLRPYRTVQNVIGGVVVTFDDVTEKEIAAEAIRSTEISRRIYFEDIVNTVREPLVVLDAEYKVISASRSFYEIFRVKAEEVEGQVLFDLGNRQWDIAPLRTLIERVLSREEAFDDFKVEHDFPSIGRRAMLLNGRKIRTGDDRKAMILLAIERVSDD